MAQRFEIIDGEIVIRSDNPIPPNTEPPVLPRDITTVDNFLEGEERDTITFSLDERLRDRAIAELVERGDGANPNEIDNRDLGNNILVDLQSDGKAYITAIMRSPVYRPTVVNEIIDQKFTEFV